MQFLSRFLCQDLTCFGFVNGLPTDFKVAVGFTGDTSHKVGLYRLFQRHVVDLELDLLLDCSKINRLSDWTLVFYFLLYRPVLYVDELNLFVFSNIVEVDLFLEL